MGFLFTDIPALIPLVARASALDDASDSDLAISALISFSSQDGFDSRFADVRLSRNPTGLGICPVGVIWANAKLTLY